MIARPSNVITDDAAISSAALGARIIQSKKQTKNAAATMHRTIAAKKLDFRSRFIPSAAIMTSGGKANAKLRMIF